MIFPNCVELVGIKVKINTVNLAFLTDVIEVAVAEISYC